MLWPKNTWYLRVSLDPSFISAAVNNHSRKVFDALSSVLFPIACQIFGGQLLPEPT
jgi:hypothetical protein